MEFTVGNAELERDLESSAKNKREYLTSTESEMIDFYRDQTETEISSPLGTSQNAEDDIVMDLAELGINTHPVTDDQEYKEYAQKQTELQELSQLKFDTMQNIINEKVEALDQINLDYLKISK